MPLQREREMKSENISKELDKISAGVKENALSMRDANHIGQFIFHADRLDKLADKLDALSTNISGSGTGTNISGSGTGTNISGSGTGND